MPHIFVFDLPVFGYFWLATKVGLRGIVIAIDKRFEVSYMQIKPPWWGPEGGDNIGKPFYFNLQSDIGFTLFTPIKGRIDSLTVYIYKWKHIRQFCPTGPWFFTSDSLHRPEIAYYGAKMGCQDRDGYSG